MGMTNECKCDACGKTESCNLALNGTPRYPAAWYVVHWQIKKNGGYDNCAVLSYCPECGEGKLKAAASDVFNASDFVVKSYTVFMAIQNNPNMCAKCCEPEERHSPDAEKRCPS